MPFVLNACKSALFRQEIVSVSQCVDWGFGSSLRLAGGIGLRGNTHHQVRDKMLMYWKYRETVGLLMKGGAR